MELHIYEFNNDVPERFKRLEPVGITIATCAEDALIIEQFKDEQLTCLNIHLN